VAIPRGPLPRRPKSIRACRWFNTTTPSARPRHNLWSPYCQSRLSNLIPSRSNDIQHHHLHAIRRSFTSCHWPLYFPRSLAHFGDTILRSIPIKHPAAQAAVSHLEERCSINLRLLPKSAGILSPISCHWLACRRLGTHLQHPCWPRTRL